MDPVRGEIPPVLGIKLVDQRIRRRQGLIIKLGIPEPEVIFSPQSVVHANGVVVVTMVIRKNVEAIDIHVCRT